MVEIKYEKLMQDNGIKLEDLPKNAQTGIKSIKQWQQMVNLHVKTQKKTSQDIYDKMEANDAWVCKEIENYIAGKASTGTKAPITGPTEAEIEAEKVKAAQEAERIAAEKKGKNEEGTTAIQEDQRGNEVDKELKVLVTAGKSSLTLAEIKNTAPNAYQILFEAYEPGGENGIETTHYRLVETEKETFTLTKK